MLTYLLFIIGFIALIKGADLLVNGASAIAKKLKISDLVIGLTIVALGTSAPELFVNIFASLNGNADIAIGNILGSNICNILLILGISALIFPLKVTKGTVWKEIPMSLLAVLLIGVMANDYLIDKINLNELTRTDGISLIAFFIIFLYYTFGIAKNETDTGSVSVEKNFSLLKSGGLILLGLIGLVIGGQWIVNGAIVIANLFGVSQSLIGLTIVAIGTSLPELATSAVAAYKKNADIAVGNIVGSNIFNVFWILGLSSMIKPLPFQPKNNIDIGMTIFATFLLFLWMFVGKKRILERWQGLSFILLYFGYIIFLILQDKIG